jgi:hypothetical protein
MHNDTIEQQLTDFCADIVAFDQVFGPQDAPTEMSMLQDDRSCPIHAHSLQASSVRRWRSAYGEAR